MKQFSFPLNASYDAIHVRRGDKLIAEAKKVVIPYWRSKGYNDEASFPTNYIPFEHYVQMAWGKVGCRNMREMLKHLKERPRTVFIATDDPVTVQKEIQSLPKARDGNPKISYCGHKAMFVFSPSSKTTNSFHLNDRAKGDDCHNVYQRNIAAIADMIVLARANKLVADFNSNWGRFIRNFRMFLDGKTHVALRDMTAAFGNSHPGPPGS
jgi:hypothetical protein